MQRAERSVPSPSAAGSAGIEGISRGKELRSVFLHSPKREDGLFPPGSGLECAWSLWGWKCRVISSERKNTSRGFSRSGGDLAASTVQVIHGWLGCNPPSAAL